MARHLNFWHNLHMILGSISHQLAHLLLSVESLIRHLYIVLSPAVRSLLGELWILLNLDSPRLVVHKMQVQSVELIASHLRDESLEFVEGDKGAGRVDHQLAYMSARSVLNGELRNSIYTLLVARTTQNLVESHQSPEHATWCLALDIDALGIHSKRVSLVVVERSVDVECKLQATLTAVHDIADAIREHLASLLNLIVKHSSGTVHVRHNDVPSSMHVDILGTLLYGEQLRHRSQALCRVAHLTSHLRLSIESAPACSLHISLLAALRNDKLYAARSDAIERRHISLRWNLRA